MKSADIAAALVAGFQTNNNGNTDIGWHTGVVTAWDDATGLNSILINGNTFNNLSVITPSSTVTIVTGDTVAIMRVQTQYFILGKVAAPGAGAALRPRQSVVLTGETCSSTTFTDLATVGPVVSNVYIGPSRSCMVLVSCGIINNNGSGYMGFAVSGASTIAANGLRTAYFQNPSGANLEITATQVVVLSAADGLNQGFNTFTAKYAKGGTLNASFDGRTLTVFPF